MTVLLTVLLLLTLFQPYDNAEFTDTWAVHIEGGEDVAKQLAEKHGFTYLGQIMPDYYHLRHRLVSKRSTYASSSHHQSLQEESKVKWLEQQQIKRRVKRSHLPRADLTIQNGQKCGI
jgi:furin